MFRKLNFLLVAAMLSAPALAQEVLPVLDSETPELINELHQREWVRLDENGMISGRLLVIGEEGSTPRVAANVIISRDGETIQATKSDIGGVFEFEGLEPGTYALQVTGDLTFAAYALHVLPSSNEHLSSQLEVLASVVPAARVKELIGSDLLPSWKEDEQEYYRSHEKDPIADSRRFNESHRIALRDGDLVGRVSRPGWDFADQDLTGTIAQLVREGDVVSKVAVGEDGFFRFDNVSPGIYDMFVSGDDGFAVVAFEAVMPQESVASKDGKVSFVSTQVGMSTDCLCCEMIQQPEITCCEPIIEEIVVDSCNTCGVDPCGCGEVLVEDPGLQGGGFGYGGYGYGGFGGGFGGGAGGGGGYAGGAGGIGGLAGAAGLAVGIAALSDDDDGFNVNLASLIGP